MNKITIAQIVAMSKNFCIGKDNDLPWHLPKDLQHFKYQTTHNLDGTLAGVAESRFNGVMLMGRKTFESMRSRPLPKRVNIIITRQTDYAQKNNLQKWINEGKIIIVDSLEKGINIGKQQVANYQLNTLWIIGGGEIFRQSLAVTERIELTKVDIEINGDAFYPNINDEFQQTNCSEKLIDEKENIGYQFFSYWRKDLKNG